MTVWVCDRHQTRELGLAAVDAPPFEEGSRVLGGPFEHVGLQPRRQSQIAGVLLDLAATLDLRDVYADIRNDTLAVQLYPSVLLVGDGADQLSITGEEAAALLDAYLERERANDPKLPVSSARVRAPCCSRLCGDRHQTASRTVCPPLNVRTHGGFS